MSKTGTKDLNEKLDLILENQKRILENEEKILGEEAKIEKMEEEELLKEDEELKDEAQVLSELSKLEKDIKMSVSSPLKRITKRDIVKGFIGAFVGVVSHFSFSKAVDLSNDLNLIYASILYVVAFVIIVVMLYYAGFRAIQKRIIFKFMPMRALVLYIVSVFTVILVYLLFGKVHLPINYLELYKMVGASIVLAVMGAGTADLIGKGE
ncbi:MAG: hypothetical protein KC589_01920 [Nanoarchaeota archaeon]|nr:hypothetical protein [Nanoarchaeota archaeon]